MISTIFAGVMLFVGFGVLAAICIHSANSLVNKPEKPKRVAKKKSVAKKGKKNVR